MNSPIKILLALIIFIGMGCSQNQNKLQKDMIGAWHLTTKGQNVYDKGVIIYSENGQMSVIISKTDSVVTGYSGKYEVNEKESYVKHYRDYYSLLPFVKDSIPPLWIRDVQLSANKKLLTLSPREEKGFSLIWEKVPN